MSTQLRWWERRGMPRATARAVALALLAMAALLPVYVVFFWRRPGTDARGAVLDAGARADAGLSTRHHAGYGARSNMRGSVDANALVANPDAYVRDTDGSDPEGM